MWVSRRHGFCFGVLPSQFLVLEWWNFLLFDDTNREFEAVVWIASGLALGTTTSLFEKRRLRRQRLGAASRSLSSSSRWGILGEYGNTSSFFRRYKCNTVTGACLKWCAVYFSLHDLLKVIISWRVQHEPSPDHVNYGIPALFSWGLVCGWHLFVSLNRNWHRCPTQRQIVRVQSIGTCPAAVVVYIWVTITNILFSPVRKWGCAKSA